MKSGIDFLHCSWNSVWAVSLKHVGLNNRQSKKKCAVIMWHNNVFRQKEISDKVAKVSFVFEKLKVLQKDQKAHLEYTQKFENGNFLLLEIEFFS